MHSTFLTAIRQNWGDPQPALMYADWLEERGDSRALPFRVLAASPQGEFASRLTCLDIFHGSVAGNQYQVWIHAPNGSRLRSKDAIPVTEEFLLWTSEQLLLRELQEPARVASFWETQRRWLRGAATREELQDATRSMPVDVQVALRNMASGRNPFESCSRILNRQFGCIRPHESLVQGSLAPVDEFSLRLCADCHWQIVDGPYAEMQTLVDRKGPLSCSRAVCYLLQGSRLLARFHRQNGAHRGLTPANLLLEKGEVTALLDIWQIAATVDSLFNENSADYLSPEPALDSHAVDLRGDLYSLGCILFFLLSGRPPFHEGTRAQRLMYHQILDAPALRSQRPDVPADLEAIYQRLMAKRPRDRYESAQELCAVLEAWLVDHPQ